MSVQVKRIAGPIELGEGPHWDEKNRCLYFVDIDCYTIHKYVPETDTHTCAKVGNKKVTLIVPIRNEKDKFIISYGCDICTIKWDGISETVSDLKVLGTVDEYPEIRINDGKCSPGGTLFYGTMPSDVKLDDNQPIRGHLYCYRDGQIKTILNDVGLSNGLAWSLDEKKFYYIDSLQWRVDSFDYNRETSQLLNKQTVFDFRKNSITGLPDGMTIDTNGNLWVACYNGAQVLQINPNTGTLLNTIKIPAKEVTSVAFGGVNLDELYVTTAKVMSSEAELKTYPDSGCLFKITGTRAKGFPGVDVKL